MRITIIQGSPRDQANTAKVARFFEEQLAQKDAVSAVRFLDIRSFNFPNWGMGEASKEDLALFQSGLVDADGLLFVVPEYNGRVPGAFKKHTRLFPRGIQEEAYGDRYGQRGTFWWSKCVV